MEEDPLLIRYRRPEDDLHYGESWMPNLCRTAIVEQRLDQANPARGKPRVLSSRALDTAPVSSLLFEGRRTAEGPG